MIIPNNLIFTKEYKMSNGLKIGLLWQHKCPNCESDLEKSNLKDCDFECPVCYLGSQMIAWNSHTGPTWALTKESKESFIINNT